MTDRACRSPPDTSPAERTSAPGQAGEPVRQPLGCSAARAGLAAPCGLRGPNRKERAQNVVRLLALGILLSFLIPTTNANAASPGPSDTRMVPVDGRRIAFHVTPGHSPIIVLDAGGGLDSSYWTSLLPALTRCTGSKIIAYDRAGMGRSDPVSGPWSLQGAERDLADGLRQLGATHDVILVTDSMAGEIATAFAQRHAGWLAGAVFVDASVPQFYTPEEVQRVAAENKAMISALTRAPSTQATRQLLAYAESFEETSRTFHRMKWPASVPVIAIVSEKTPFDTAQDASLWKQAQARFASAGANRKLLIARGSSHDIVHDSPAIILRAVHDMIARVGPRVSGAH